MRGALVVYGAVLVVLVMLTREFEAAGWRDVGAMQVTAAVVNSLLVLALAAGALLAGRLGLARWARSMRKWRTEQARATAASWPDAEVVGVTSWRPASPGPPAEIAPPPATPPTTSAGFTYVGPSYGPEARPVPPFPVRPGRRI